MAAIAGFADLRGSNALLFLGALPVWIGLLGTAVWACRRHGTGSLVRDLALRIKPVDLAIGLGVGLALRFVIGLWALLYSSLTGQQPKCNLESVLGNGLGTGFWLVVNIAAIAVIGPVIEEIFFRGVGLRSALASLLRRADNPRFADPRRRARAAIAATALLFAALHLNEISDLTSAVVLLPGLFADRLGARPADHLHRPAGSGDRLPHGVQRGCRRGVVVPAIARKGEICPRRIQGIDAAELSHDRAHSRIFCTPADAVGPDFARPGHVARGRPAALAEGVWLRPARPGRRVPAGSLTCGCGPATRAGGQIESGNGSGPRRPEVRRFVGRHGGADQAGRRADRRDPQGRQRRGRRGLGDGRHHRRADGPGPAGVAGRRRPASWTCC